MGVPTSEVGYTLAITRREDHEVHKGHVVALGEGGEKLRIYVRKNIGDDNCMAITSEKRFRLVDIHLVLDAKRRHRH